MALSDPSHPSAPWLFLADAAPPLQSQTCHLASSHLRVKRSSFSRAWRREAGRLPTPPRRGPGSGGSHPSSTPGHPHPELKHRDSQTGSCSGINTVSLAWPLPRGWSGSIITKHAEACGPRWRPFLKPRVPEISRAPSPVTAANRGEGKTQGDGGNASLGQNQTPDRAGRRLWTKPRAGDRGGV